MGTPSTTPKVRARGLPWRSPISGWRPTWCGPWSARGSPATSCALGSGVKVGKVRNLQQDIAYALAATEVRILAPIPGKSAVGVEVPNTRPATVTLGDVFRAYPEGNDWTLPVGLGKDISGRAVFFDLSEMPHLLVAGTTGSGKSVMLNGLFTSLCRSRRTRAGQDGAHRPQEGRARAVRAGTAPYHPRRYRRQEGGQRARVGGGRDGAPLRGPREDRGKVRRGYNDRAEVQMPYVVVVIDELADLNDAGRGQGRGRHHQAGPESAR